MSAAEDRGEELFITFTIFPSVWPTEAKECADVPWPDLVAKIHNAATYIAKKDCPLISLAAYGDKLSAKGYVRHAENVQRIYGIEIDYDGEEVSPEEGAQRLNAAGLKSVIYTSPSHVEGAPRWRALLPLSEPAEPEKRAFYCARANRALGGIATRESFTLSQSFYIGRVRGAVYRVIETPGRTVDMAVDLDPLYYTGHSDGTDPHDSRTDDELRAAFSAGQGRYEAMLKLSSRWAARGLPADDIEAALIALLEQGNSHNADGVDLRTRIRPLAESAARKFGGKLPELDPLFFAGIGPSPASPASAPGRRMQWADLAEKTPPERTWLIDHWLTWGLTLLAGRGGIGKSLLGQTVATALVLGRTFIDGITAPRTVLMWSCEDDHDEIWRRQIAINALFGCSMRDIEGRLIIESRMGCVNSMWALAYGALVPGPALKEWHEQVNDCHAEVALLDNIAHVFGGNENDRHHVTSFVNGLAGVTDRPLATILLGHTARSIGSEYAGSAAWENAARMRWLFDSRLPDQKPDEDAVIEDGVRYLAKRKANYSTNDFRKLTYQNGVFAPDGPNLAPTSYAAASRREDARRCVLSGLRKIVASGLSASASTASPEYLPKQLLRLRLAEDYTGRELADAMADLITGGRLVNGVVGKYANRTPKKGLMET